VPAACWPPSAPPARPGRPDQDIKPRFDFGRRPHKLDIRVAARSHVAANAGRHGSRTRLGQPGLPVQPQRFAGWPAWQRGRVLTVHVPLRGRAGPLRQARRRRGPGRLCRPDRPQQAGSDRGGKCGTGRRTGDDRPGNRAEWGAAEELAQARVSTMAASVAADSALVPIVSRLPPLVSSVCALASSEARNGPTGRRRSAGFLRSGWCGRVIARPPARAACR
jgi:hypothetical protein